MSAIVDMVLISLVIYRPSIWLAIWIAVLITLRRVPYLANEIANMLDLESYSGLTLIVARLLLPGWESREMLMSRTMDLSREKAHTPVHVPVPSSTGSPDTIAISYKDDATMRDQFFNSMADARDERGAWLFSANQIHAAFGGKRADVLDKIRERRSAIAPAQFREDDGSIGPATYPVTKG